MKGTRQLASLRSAIVLAMGLSLSQSALAVNLGPIQVNSYLGQPLRASIILTDISDAQAQSAKVRLAENAAYQARGIAKTPEQGALQFYVRKTGDQYRVIVSTNTAVNEPFINFILSFHAGSSELNREYAVFLNPDPAAQAGLIATPIESMSAVALPKNIRPADPKTQGWGGQMQPAAPAYQGGTYGPIKAGETLYSIAVATRPNESISVNEWMQQIFSANRHAFSSSSLSSLKKNEVLTLPSGAKPAENVSSGRTKTTPKKPQKPVTSTAPSVNNVQEPPKPTEEAPETPAAESSDIPSTSQIDIPEEEENSAVVPVEMKPEEVAQLKPEETPEVLPTTGQKIEPPAPNEPEVAKTEAPEITTEPEAPAEIAPELPDAVPLQEPLPANDEQLALDDPHTIPVEEPAAPPVEEPEITPPVEEPVAPPEAIVEKPKNDAPRVETNKQPVQLADEAQKTDDSDKIFGIPKLYLFGGFGLVSLLLAGLVGYKLIRKRRGNHYDEQYSELVDYDDQIAELVAEMEEREQVKTASVSSGEDDFSDLDEMSFQEKHEDYSDDESTHSFDNYDKSTDAESVIDDDDFFGGEDFSSTDDDHSSARVETASDDDFFSGEDFGSGDEASKPEKIAEIPAASDDDFFSGEDFGFGDDAAEPEKVAETPAPAADDDFFSGEDFGFGDDTAAAPEKVAETPAPAADDDFFSGEDFGFGDDAAEPEKVAETPAPAADDDFFSGEDFGFGDDTAEPEKVAETPAPAADDDFFSGDFGFGDDTAAPEKVAETPAPATDDFFSDAAVKEELDSNLDAIQETIAPEVPETVVAPEPEVDEQAMAINIDLAATYIASGVKPEKARIWLNEVLEKGTDAQKEQAQNLLKKLG
ncbi:FimV/HubP family polar landmark protein [Dichelobacter nodosus]|uniref:FimV/HubP family polar landmark protein n=1 Tax=Dichelobacter nodosus TaxID=870 RepID=UPI001432A2BD|nr:FimV/HubP family polar landmark protein [Dichelobacter nodosus]